MGDLARSSVFEHDVFISYSHADSAAAKGLQAALAERGLKVWRDERLGDAPGSSLIATVNAALERSAKVLVLWSRTSVGSAWVHGEAERARMSEKIVTLALEPVASLLGFIPAPFNILPTLEGSGTLDLDALLRALGAQQVEGAHKGVVSLVAAQADITKLPDTFARKLYGRESEMAALVEAWDRGLTRIFAFDAMGGAGKTALVYHFVQALKASGWRGARRVFAWSFYSQGSNEDRQTSADEFFKAAFKFFGDGEQEPPKDPREKGVDLARLVQGQRTLLILDGLEPLQYAAGKTGGGRTDKGRVGGVKDPGIKALLSLLADHNPGLCLVTTRIELAELKGTHGVTFEALDRLPLMPAIDLLRDLGVEPGTPPQGYKLPPASELAALTPPFKVPAEYVVAAGDDRRTVPASAARQLIRAVDELQGHALALTLVGNYLVEHHRGDIRAIGDLPKLADLDPSAPERSPYRVMRAIEIGLARRIDEQGKTVRPAETIAGRELAILFFLGFFDRPADTSLLGVVFPKEGTLQAEAADVTLAATVLPPVEDEDALPEAEQERRRLVREARRRVLLRRLFSAMHGISSGELRSALAELAKRGLVAKLDAADTWDRAAIDCHPLVREYFGSRLKELDTAAYQAAHGRLYDHYRYAGLPQTFRNRAAYGLLAVKASFPDMPSNAAVQGIISGELTRQRAPQFPFSIFSASHRELEQAGRLVNGPDWDKALTAFLPETEAGMTPLFSAIVHGCAAGRQEEVWSDVYQPRISRGGQSFAVRILGLYGQSLSALASFFTQPFSQPAEHLPLALQSLLLGQAGFRLRALGRHTDAVEPIRRAFEVDEERGDKLQATRIAVNLAELLLVLGRLEGEDGALAVAAKVAEYAEEIRDNGSRLTSRATAYGPALLAAGKIAHAEKLYREAEALQQEENPSNPQMFSFGGFLHCLLMLARGRTAEVDEYADASLYTALNGSEYRPNIAFAKMSKALAQLALWEHAGPKGPAGGDAKELVKLASDALAATYHANSEQDLPLALVAHAEALWRAGDLTAAARNLREAEIITRRGPMPLLLVQVELLRARIAVAERRVSDARTHKGAALELAQARGYRRGLPEIAVLDAEIAAAEGAPDVSSRLEAAARAIRGEPYVDRKSGRSIDGGWWGLWPRLDAIMPRAHPARSELETARARYNAERDAYLAGESAKLGKHWEKEDRLLADPTFRRGLDELLVKAGYKPLEQTPLGERRKAARQFKELEQAAEMHEQGLITPDDISDSEAENALSDPRMRETMEAYLKSRDINVQLSTIPRESVKALLADIYNITKRAEKDEKGGRGGRGQGRPEVSDELLDKVLANPEMVEMIEKIMRDAGIDTPVRRMSRETQRAAVAALMVAMRDAEEAGKRGEGARADRGRSGGGGRAGNYPEVSDEVLDEILSDSKTRRLLQKALQDSGISTPIDLMAREEQRAAVAAMLAAAREVEEEKRREADGGGPGRGGPSGGYPEVSDELLDEVLADSKARTVLQRALTASGVDTPIDLMPREEQRAAVAAMLAAAREAKEEDQRRAQARDTPPSFLAQTLEETSPLPEPVRRDEPEERAPEDEGPDVPTEVVLQIFADPDAQRLLSEVMRQNDLRGLPRDLPFETQRAIVQLLVRQGSISLGKSRSTGSRMPDPPPEASGRGGRWWPFGRKN